MAARRARRTALRELRRAHRADTEQLVESLQAAFAGTATVTVLSYGDPARDPAYGGTPWPLPWRRRR